MKFKLFRFNSDNDFGTEWYFDFVRLGSITLLTVDADWSDFMTCPQMGASVSIPWKRPLFSLTFHFGKFSLWLDFLLLKSKYRDYYFAPKDSIKALIEEELKGEG